MGTVLALSLLLTATPAATAQATFVNLKSIVGEWEAPVGKEGKVVRAAYQLVSNGTVLEGDAERCQHDDRLSSRRERAAHDALLRAGNPSHGCGGSARRTEC